MKISLQMIQLNNYLVHDTDTQIYNNTFHFKVINRNLFLTDTKQFKVVIQSLKQKNKNIEFIVIPISP